MKRLEISSINQYRGFTTQEDAAEKLGVSLSTLKRRCQDLRLGKWPKRKLDHSLNSSTSRLKETKSVDIDGIYVQQHDIGLFSSSNALVESVVKDAHPITTGDYEIQHFPINGERVNVVPTRGNDKGVAFGYNEIGCCASGVASSEESLRSCDDGNTIDGFGKAEAEIAMDAIPSGEEVEAAAETLDGKLVRSHKMLGSSIQETAGSSKEIFTIDGDEITLDIINQYRGRANLADVAKDLKVSRATLKRRLRKLGIKRWPRYKRNEGHNIQSRQCSDNNEAAVSVSIPAIENGKSFTPGNHKIDQGHPLVVKAIFRDDIAKFPFDSNSGIEELHRELHKRFELEVGRFKIKYKDEDEDGNTEWINLSCNEDLIFRIETLTASKKSTMILSVFPFPL